MTAYRTAAVRPSFSVVNPDDVAVPAATASLTKVDFSRFLTLTAKIDRLDFYCREAELAPGKFEALKAQIKDGLLVRPQGRRWGHPGAAWLSINDPSPRDLQFLTERFHDSRVFHLEVAVDAKLQPGANDLSPLHELKSQLRHSMYPQQHSRLPNARRKHYDIAAKRYRDDGLGTPCPNGQIIWEASGVDDKMALYIKEKDRERYVGQPWLRMEARLIGGGCAAAGIHLLGMFPNFVPNLRTHVADMFFVADGFKNEAAIAVGRGVPKNPWFRWGSQWKPKVGVAILHPDRIANAMIGSALNNLRTKLKVIKPPTAVSHRYKDWIDENTF